MSQFKIGNKVRNTRNSVEGTIVDILNDKVYCLHDNNDGSSSYSLNEILDLEHIGEPMKPWVVNIEVKVSGLADLERINTITKELYVQVRDLAKLGFDVSTLGVK